MWQEWTTIQQVCFCVAMLFSLILVVQLVLMLIGASGDGDAEIDLDGDGDGDIFVDGDSGLALFTIKGLISFFAVGGWVGFALGDGTLKPIWAVLISVAAGAIALVGVGFIMRWLISLADSGTMDLNNSVGKVAEVYLTIPPHCEGSGKITVEVQGKLAELEAMQEGDTPIKTGAKVKVIKTDGATCFVEKLY